MIGARERHLIEPDDRIDVPRVGLVLVALITLAFVVGAFDALMSNHFASWHRLTLQPEGSFPRFVEDAVPTLRAVTMVGGAAFGYTSIRRALIEGPGRVGIRLVLVTFSPIFVELLDFGTQDGSVPDLERVPVHSMTLLVFVSLAPAILAAVDTHRLRTDLR